MRKFTAVLLILLLAVSIPFTATAHDVPVDRDDCSIEILVRYNGENVDGGTLTAVKVGYVDENDGNYFFSRVGDDVMLENVSSDEAVKALEEYYNSKKDSVTFTTVTANANSGICEFSGLSTGLYLIIQNEPAPGFSAMNAFLVSVPQMIDNVYVYHITATIKAELKREPDPTDPPPTTAPTTPTTTPTTPTTTPPAPSGPSLPQTGQLNWPIPVMAAGGMLLFLLGSFTYSKNKKKNHEK